MAKKPVKKTTEKIDISNVIGFNLKTRKKEKILDPKLVELKNGRNAVKGHGKNGTKIFRII